MIKQLFISIMVVLIIMWFITLVFAEQINDHCFKYDTVLSCGTKTQEYKEMAKVAQPKIETKEDEPLIIKTTWSEDNSNIMEGVASFYTVKSSGKFTANGERFNEQALTCAFNDAPFNTFLKVTNIENGKFVYCRINDRGGFKKYNRIVDLSPRAFSKIANIKEGLIKVKIEILK